MAADQDTEITLGTGKMLGLFFGLVALCAVFFGMGYSLGRNSNKPLLASEAGTPVAAASTLTKTATSSDNSSKPADLTFYKTVEQKDANPQLATPDANTARPSSAPAPTLNTDGQPAPPDPTTIGNNSSYYVQVAAVTKHEDADALVEALKKKQYPAFTANNSATDKLFHVQVGPYGDIKDAEATRAKLISDGYNPILKK